MKNKDYVEVIYNKKDKPYIIYPLKFSKYFKRFFINKKPIEIFFNENNSQKWLKNFYISLIKIKKISTKKPVSK